MSVLEKIIVVVAPISVVLGVFLTTWSRDAFSGFTSGLVLGVWLMFLRIIKSRGGAK